MAQLNGSKGSTQEVKYNTKSTDPLTEKYKQMAELRKDYDDIDITECIPTLEEMMDDDLMTDFFEEIAEKDTAIDTAFYMDEPGPGNYVSRYDEKNNVFYIKCNNFNNSALFKELNLTDGDTMRFSMSSLDTDFSFTKNNKSYDSFEDYYNEGRTTESYETLVVRAVGIDAPEIPHYDIQPMKDKDIVKMTIAEAKRKNALFTNVKYNKTTGTATERLSNEEVSFYKNNNNYYEIINPNKDYSGYIEKGVINPDYKYRKILASKDESKEGTIKDGYKAQSDLLELLNSAQEIILKIDGNFLKANKQTSKYKLNYSHWWNVGSAIGNLIDQWQDTTGDIPLTRLTYSPYGTDGHDRYFGEIYVKKNIKGKDAWINANKYVLNFSDFTVSNPDFTGSPEMNNIYGNVSKDFDLWSYDKDNQMYLDSFEEQTKDSHKARYKFHKDVTGIDFEKFRSCTMMLGDVLFMIPPTSIRSVTNVEYEKVNILRGKGSMVKGLSQSDKYLEIDLFFSDDYGINGIKTDITFPNGEPGTYYMNGLRALIAQFKVAPYLPIENQYINDVLGIEAVSLLNFHVGTVDGYPRLLKATLTLREFNYRIYMPDIPIDLEAMASTDITEINPIFAKCFHWEIFRYYYQRLLMKGEELRKYDYNSREYLDLYYYNKGGVGGLTVKSALKPVGFCEMSDKISFYVPDENWLANALSIKKDKDYYGQRPITVEPTDNVKKFIEQAGPASREIVVNNTYIQNIADNFILSPDANKNNETSAMTRKDVLKSKNSFLSYKSGSSTSQVKPQSASSVTIPNNISSMFTGYTKKSVDGGNMSGNRTPNTVVDIGYGSREYWAFTNEHGQVFKVVAKKIVLQDDSKEPVTSNGRYYDDQADVPGTERSDLDKGHIIADSLGGVANAYNITPQNRTLNQEGGIWAMEDEIRKAGGCTDFVAIITYPDTQTQIPSHYSYSYNVNGKKVNKNFKNEEPGTKTFNKETALNDMIMDVANRVSSSEALRYISTDETYDPKNNTLTWTLKFKPIGITNGSEDMTTLKEVLRNLMGKSSTNDIIKNNVIPVTITASLNNSRINPSVKLSAPEIFAMAKYNGDTYENSYNEAEVYDYTNPAAMKFIPYLESVSLNGLAFGLTNTFTEMSLKIMDGSAPQYMGSADTYIELSIITDDQITVAALNALPSHACKLTKLYRRILSAWPIRVKNAYLQMAGINEVLIDNVAVETVEGYPGLYQIKMRMTSVDRIMRQREMMQQLQSKEETTSLKKAQINSYFNLEDTLASAEVYPDLDLPLLSELKKLGYRFIRYSGTARTFPDPDFYMIYSYDYAAKIIKKNIKNELAKNLYHVTDAQEGDKAVRRVKFKDSIGMEVETQMSAFSGLDIINQGDIADMFDNAIKDIEEGARKNIPKKHNNSRSYEYSEDSAEIGSVLYYLTLCDMTEGWELQPGYVATMVPPPTNDAVEKCGLSNLSTEKTKDSDKTNLYAKEIYEKRAKAIQLIDTILSKPIEFKKFNKQKGFNEVFHKESNAMTVFFGHIVREFFINGKEEEELFKLLCPVENYDEEFIVTKKGVEQLEADKLRSVPLGFAASFLMSAACALSGNEPKTETATNSNAADWAPNQFVSDGTPRCKTADGRQAKNLNAAIKYGKEFGMFAIREETADEIKKRILPDGKVEYTPNTFDFYKTYKDGFIDPYYNKSKKSVIDEYKKEISSNEGANAAAFLRIVLVYLRKQIIEGYYFSEIDIIMQDWDSIKKKLVGESDDPTIWEYLKGTGEWISEGAENNENIGDWLGDLLKLPVNAFSLMFNEDSKAGKEIQSNIDEDAAEQLQGISEEEAKKINAIVSNIPDTYKKSFCARLVYMFLEAAANVSKGTDETIVDYLENRRFDVLNGLTSSTVVFGIKTNSVLARFLAASVGFTNNIQKKIKDLASTTSDSQKALNGILREAFTALSDDVQAYTLHSFYDMLINDKRGRLVRAFPAYYITFIDEGRKIGSWKLFDNFYNMSAIADLTVTKSRKMPADTCTFIMSNIFGSYAEQYDNTTREQYLDVYSFKDVFNSIFSPKSYLEKEDALRRRKDNLETVVLQPGTRIHVRMGYTSDASKMPTVFNGKIAEIDVGDAVTVVAQGDGCELMNPLNALGEIDATNIIESQGWITALKDLRGSFARGGLTPRNLLVQLLTAQHGGVMRNYIKEVSSERFYSDNPFGIYHFGDIRFRDIFEESELVQNLYEVVNGTLLAGVNELVPPETTSKVAPILNTTLQDKTFWDILQLCAYSGDGYIGAIRDFGFRSTVCLCKPNQYYAFKYRMVDKKYTEVRKPFQQFHYYDSYTDIIYNSIKASEKNMKTNAVGVFEGSQWLWWGHESKTVGPIYLDFNIYPEHQKSMTVDTGLVAVGNGGIDIPFITNAREEWNLDSEDNKVNKSLAEKITANTLRESVMGMYVGEICVIGDPSVKPCDRIGINDYYEDMYGQMEVEGVVYSMNAQTGFTTTIYPDLIVRTEDTHEAAREICIGGFLSSAAIGYGARNFVVNKLAALGTKALQSGAAQGLGRLLTTAGLNIGAGGAAAGGTAVAGAAAFAPFIAAAVIAGGAYIVGKNAKVALTRFTRNVQALDVYPIIKNKRVLIAGMAGHKGSVVGYDYKESDMKDSIQNIIVRCIEGTQDAVPGLGKLLTSAIMDDDEYNNTVVNWSNTFTDMEADPKYKENVKRVGATEAMLQELYNSVSLEFSARSAMIQMLRTKYRVNTLETNKGSDPTYKKYENLFVSLNKLSEDEKLKGATDLSGKSKYEITSIYSNKNVLSLYPIEDDPDIKKAVAGTHSVVKRLTIAHSQGNAEVTLPFESGARVIKFFTSDNYTKNTKLQGYPIMDLPMVQQDSMYILKLLLNDENLKDKEVTFLSGARINDPNTWKNTGFWFVLGCNDSTAMKQALDSIKDDTAWYKNEENIDTFTYKQNREKFLINIYPEV